MWWLYILLPEIYLFIAGLFSCNNVFLRLYAFVQLSLYPNPATVVSYFWSLFWAPQQYSSLLPLRAHCIIQKHNYSSSHPDFSNVCLYISCLFVACLKGKKHNLSSQCQRLPYDRHVKYEEWMMESFFADSTVSCCPAPFTCWMSL